MPMHNDYLVHHGILGMKWGVRKYQDTNGNLTTAGKKRYVSDNKNKFNLTDQQKETAKKIAIGAAAVGGTLLVAYGAYKLHNKNVGDVSSLGKSYIESIGKVSKTASNYEEALSDDAKAVNRGGLLADLFLRNRSENCSYCTTAMDARRRGYDVSSGWTPHGEIPSTIAAFYKNAKIEHFDPSSGLYKPNDFASFKKKLVSQGEGASGHIMGLYPIGGGHDIYYEVHNNKLNIVDAQIGKTYTSDSDMSKKLKQFYDIRYMRTDNLDFSETIKSDLEYPGMGEHPIVIDRKSSLLKERPSDLALETGAVAGMTAYKMSSNNKNTSVKRNTNAKYARS